MQYAEIVQASHIPVQEEIKSLHTAEGSSAPATEQSSAPADASATPERLNAAAARAAAARSQIGAGWGGPAAIKQRRAARHATAMPAVSAAPAEAAASAPQKRGRMPARRGEAVLAAKGSSMETAMAAPQRKGAKLREPEPEATRDARAASLPRSPPPAEPRQPAQSSCHVKIASPGTVGQPAVLSATEAPKVVPALLDTLELLEPDAEDLLGDSSRRERRASSSPGRASESGRGSRRSSPASKLASQIPPRSPVRAHLAAQQVCATPHN